MVFVHCNISYVQHIGSVAHAYAHAQTKALLPHRAIVRSSFLSIVFDGHMKSSTFFYLSSLTIRYSFFNWISKPKRSNTKQTRNILSKTIWCSLKLHKHTCTVHRQHTEYRTRECVLHACLYCLPFFSSSYDCDILDFHVSSLSFQCSIFQSELSSIA